MSDNPFQSPRTCDQQESIPLGYRLRVLFGMCVVGSVLLGLLWSALR